MVSIMASVTLSLVVAQRSTTLLYFSPLVIKPSWYWLSKSLTWSCASIRPLGVWNDHVILTKRIPTAAACRPKRRCGQQRQLTLSDRRRSKRRPTARRLLLVRMVFVPNAIRGSDGRFSAKITRPGVVSTTWVMCAPFSSTSRTRAFTLLCNERGRTQSMLYFVDTNGHALAWLAIAFKHK